MFRDWKTNLSWMILIAGAIWGLSQTAGRGWSQETQTVLGSAYAAWAVFWGLPPFLKWWGFQIPNDAWRPIRMNYQVEWHSAL